jgi:WhiB family redox-sensing transcriptional regulator
MERLVATPQLQKLFEAIDGMEHEPPCQNFPETFYPDWTQKGATEFTNYAKALCADCPIRVQCATYAFEANEEHGIFGGLTPAERNDLRRTGRRAS